ncbi:MULTISPECIES: acyl-CoA thioesterase [Prauserella salsuginis group]|uniref:Acyl-CoA thioester hydrolase n=2 Tax=Prauserella salsuginis group TaxID=2893672 RepID=A0A839XS61_9PSEU|nr:MULTISPECIES: thioesterase family protein [Prauserella salsuginis group]MBB3664284.1 acyl-CoA thioester hydrolase [Prauserella sediminis]MCR3721729.1 acyl-CoA thioester hydrolase [Prauserella flava]MCR3734420.1 acyl-CoA thioester hydrolase [Prauserella salsuginis]
MSVGEYVTHVRPRWSDMDAFGHVNHARMVTLLEEARVPLLFDDATAQGLGEFAKGTVVVKLGVDYKEPVIVDGKQLRVGITMTRLQQASFTLAYRVHNGPSESDPVAVTAWTLLAPYDVGAARPRRLAAQERAFLTDHIPEADRA